MGSSMTYISVSPDLIRNQGAFFILERYVLFDFIDLRERKRNTNLFFHFFIHSLVDSYMCLTGD